MSNKKFFFLKNVLYSATFWFGYKKYVNSVQLPKNYEESLYIKRLAYITHKDPDFNNKVLDLLRNREDSKNWLLATSDYGNELQKDLNAIVGYDEKVNAIVRHALDLKIPICLI